MERAGDAGAMTEVIGKVGQMLHLKQSTVPASQPPSLLTPPPPLPRWAHWIRPWAAASLWTGARASCRCRRPPSPLPSAPPFCGAPATCHSPSAGTAPVQNRTSRWCEGTHACAAPHTHLLLASPHPCCGCVPLMPPPRYVASAPPCTTTCARCSSPPTGTCSRALVPSRSGSTCSSPAGAPCWQQA